METPDLFEMKLLILIYLTLSFVTCDKNEIESSFEDYEVNEVIIQEYHKIFELGESSYDLISIDSKRNFFFIDILEKKILKFDSEGVLIAKHGEIGNGPNQFSENIALKGDINGNTLYIIEVGGFRVFEYDLNLEYKRELTMNNQAYQIDIVNSDSFLIASSSNSINGLDLSMGLVDNKFKKYKQNTYSINSQEFFYEMLFELAYLGGGKYVFCYLATNRCKIQDYEQESETIYFKVKNHEEKAEGEEKGFGRVVPNYLLFRDLFYDNVSDSIFLLEGIKETDEYEGGNTIHVFKANGSYKLSYVLPFNVEQLYVVRDTLYLIRKDGLKNEIVTVHL